MKTLYTTVRKISLILSIFILFQSCHVYHQVPVSLDEAATANKRVKIINTNNKKYKFLKVEKSDSMYYGYTRNAGKLKKTPISKDEIKSVHLTNKTASTVLTVGTVTLVSTVGLVALA